jgi:excisionase family DNA binding protein
MSELEDINSFEQTGEYLKISAQQVRQLTYNGKLGFVKSGRTRTIPREAIEAFVAANTIQATPPPPHGLTRRSWQNLQRRNHSASRE